MKHFCLRFLFFVLFINACAYSQSLEKIVKLDPKLDEISGLAFWNDSILVAHNDSGDKPVLYFLDLKGNLIHQVNVSKATNVDWEDITTDGKGTIYIADIGNNTNRRKDLKIYVVKDKAILKKNEVEASVINLNYADQTAFPPENKTDWHYDAEALGFYRDSLVIFTKSQTKPYDGVTFCYKLPAKPGTYDLKPVQKIQLKARRNTLDAVTSVAFLENKCYLLTYSGIELFSIDPKKKQFLEAENRISFFLPTQKEAIAVNRAYIYIADEYNGKVGGRNLYQLKNE